MLEWYTNKAALVTGATSGIGRAIAIELVRRGAKVILCGRDTEAMDLLLRDLSMQCYPPKVFMADFCKIFEFKRLVVSVRNSDIDILVNSAGFGYMGDFRSMTVPNLWPIQQVNMWAMVRLTSALLPRMIRKKDGGILNVGSTASFFATPGSALYGATKHFVLGFTDALHQELLDSGVHVTGLYPGHTHTRFIERATNGKVKNWEKAMSPESVAKLALDGLNKNKIRVIPGLGNKLRVVVAPFIPTTLLMKNIYGKAKERNES